MSTSPDMADRHARVLARLTEMGLALAERTFEDAQAAETPAERIEAVKAFHTVSCSVRQCVALEARLTRQQAQEARVAERTEAQAPSRKPGDADISRPVTAVRAAVARVCLELGLSEDAALNWRDLPATPGPSNLDDGDDPPDAALSPPPDAPTPEPRPQNSA